jgi:hypothetical protein
MSTKFLFPFGLFLLLVTDVVLSIMIAGMWRRRKSAIVRARCECKLLAFPHCLDITFKHRACTVENNFQPRALFLIVAAQVS